MFLHEDIADDALKVYMIDIVDKQIAGDILHDRITELENLVTTYGGVAMRKEYQKREQPDYKYYIGKGKLAEVVDEMFHMDADVLVIGNILRPAQLFNINEYLRERSDKEQRKIPMQARDRVDLILKIFDQHAISEESRLQIALAAVKHMGPRIFGMGMELSRQAGGIGTRGIGETNIERMKRHLREREYRIREKLKEFSKMRKLHRDARQKKGLKTVGLVGYTNAGKSSLLNILTNKDVLAEDKLFATLGTNVGKLYVMTDTVMGTGHEILLNDTIGFIRDLPPKLIDAFASTLEDSIMSDLLLHVIDASDTFRIERMKVVDNILTDIGATQPRLLIFNKIDKLSDVQVAALQQQYGHDDAVYLSVYEETGLDILQTKMLEKLGLE